MDVVLVRSCASAAPFLVWTPEWLDPLGWLAAWQFASSKIGYGVALCKKCGLGCTSTCFSLVIS
jgi:hypothetical protein